MLGIQLTDNGRRGGLLLQSRDELWETQLQPARQMRPDDRALS